MSIFWIQALPLIAIFFIFYAIVIRPGRKKEKERYQSALTLQEGDRIMTVSGFYGDVIKIFPSKSPDGLSDEIEFELEIAPGISIRCAWEAFKSKIAK